MLLLKGPGDNGFVTGGCGEAINDCTALGGHLAIIRDADENDYVFCRITRKDETMNCSSLGTGRHI